MRRLGFAVWLAIAGVQGSCPYVGFAAIENQLAETMVWQVNAGAPGFEDTVVPVTVPYNVGSCQVHDVDAVIRMKKL